MSTQASPVLHLNYRPGGGESELTQKPPKNKSGVCLRFNRSYMTLSDKEVTSND